MNKKTTRRFVFGLLAGLIFCLVVLGFAIVQSRSATENALLAMDSNDQVQFSNGGDDWLVFIPRNAESFVGFIFLALTFSAVMRLLALGAA